MINTSSQLGGFGEELQESRVGASTLTHGSMQTSHSVAAADVHFAERAFNSFNS